MKQSIFYTFILFVLYSCGNSDASKKVNSIEVKAEAVAQPELPIRDFIKKFKIIQTPFYYRGGYVGENYESQLFELKSNSIDTLFHEVPDNVATYGYGMLADTSNFYSLIYFHTADDHYPVLYTYSKTGKFLSEEPLIVRGCGGSDCGLKYCSSTAVIDKDYSISLGDTVYYEGECDTTGNYLPNSDSTFIYSRTGSIDKNGVIKMGDEIEQRIGGKK